MNLNKLNPKYFILIIYNFIIKIFSYNISNILIPISPILFNKYLVIIFTILFINLDKLNTKYLVIIYPIYLKVLALRLNLLVSDLLLVLVQDR